MAGLWVTLSAESRAGRAMEKPRVLRAARKHLPVVIILTLLIVVMTYPTAAHVFDFETFWLPTRVQDVWTKLWNTWYGKQVLAGQAQAHHTNLMFYPHGVSLAYHTYSIPHMLVAGFLETFMPAANAYNLTYLFIIFSAALAAYVYLHYLFRDRWVSLFGAVIFGCSSYVVGRPSQPDVSIIATIPLSLYCLHRALREERWTWAALSGLLAGATAFIGIYTYVCLLMALGLVILCFARRRWRDRGFWLRVMALVFIAGAMGVMRVYPMTQSPELLEQALTKRGGEEFNTDLVYSVVNLHHPVITPLVRRLFPLDVDPRWNSVYMGLVPLALVVYGLARGAHRRKMAFWLCLMALFLVLRLGSELTVNGVRYEAIVLPKRLLEELFPTVFAAFYSPDYFYSCALFPLAVLSCYGLLTLLRTLTSRLRPPVIALCIVAVAFEYYGSLEHTVVSDEQLAFLDFLAGKDDQEAIRLIHAPMGRVNAKLYDFYQTLSGYPHAEGVAGRTPPAAYDTINGSLLLRTWSADDSIQCRHRNERQYLAALAALEGDGFSHVVMHREMWNSQSVKASFDYADARYQDDFAAVYRLSDLRQSCPSEMAGSDMAGHLGAFLAEAAPRARSNEMALSLHPGAALPDKLFRYYAEQLKGWKAFAHVWHDEDGALRIQSSRADYADAEAITAGSSIVWLVYNPAVDPRERPAYRDWLGRDYRRCRRVVLGEDSIAEMFIKRGFSCAMVDAETALAVRYDAGIQLAELRYQADAELLQVSMWWSDAGDGNYAYSIQVFDAKGDKVAQSGDRVIGFDPLSLHQTDISALPAGDYSARLIVYHRGTLEAQAGVVAGDGRRFQRELEIARFSISG